MPLGDTHGNMSWVCNYIIPYAQAQGCSHIVQVGDFGFVWPDNDYPRNLDKLQRILDRHDVTMVFLPGNHEDHRKLATIEEISERNEVGHFVMRPRLHYTGRVAAWTWDDVRFAAVGGAVSVDRAWRQEEVKRGRKQVWWYQETLTRDEFEQAKALGPVDVLFSHDAPIDFPSHWLKPDLESAMNRGAMTDVGRALRPRRWFHGHYHTNLTYPFHHDDGTCWVSCLDMDGTTRDSATTILDLENITHE